MTTETQEPTTVNPQVVGAILSMAIFRQEQDQSKTLAEYIVDSTKRYLTHDDVSLQGDITNVVLAYYLTCYMQYYSIAAQMLDIAPDRKILQAEAIRAIFDMYLKDPSVHIVRRILPLAAESAHQIACKDLEKLPDERIRSAIVSLGNFSMITMSLRTYLKPRYRIYNLPYISWVRAQIDGWLSDPESMIDSFASDSDKIVKALQNKNRIIDLPN